MIYNEHDIENRYYKFDEKPISSVVNTFLNNILWATKN